MTTGALAQLLESRRDPCSPLGAGRNSLLALFGLLGEQDARTQRYRAELLNVRPDGYFSRLAPVRQKR